jgi:hypothetical protein
MSNMVDSEKERLNRINSNLSTISISLGILKNMGNRIKNISDPVIKYSIFVDRLCFLLDVLNAGIEVGLEEFISIDNVDSSLKCEVDEIKSRICKLKEDGKFVSEGLKKDCDGLMTWIQSPVYSPDHAFGMNYVNAKSSEHDMA